MNPGNIMNTLIDDEHSLHAGTRSRFHRNSPQRNSDSIKRVLNHDQSIVKHDCTKESVVRKGVVAVGEISQTLKLLEMNFKLLCTTDKTAPNYDKHVSTLGGQILQLKAKVQALEDFGPNVFEDAPSKSSAMKGHVGEHADWQLNVKASDGTFGRDVLCTASSEAPTISSEAATISSEAATISSEADVMFAEGDMISSEAPTPKKEKMQGRLSSVSRSNVVEHRADSSSNLLVKRPKPRNNAQLSHMKKEFQMQVRKMAESYQEQIQHQKEEISHLKKTLVAFDFTNKAQSREAKLLKKRLETQTGLSLPKC